MEDGHRATVGGVHLMPPLRLRLLGGFQVERYGQLVPETAWRQRRSAKTLIKILATDPAHSLHREQLLEYLWPEVEFESAVNSFGKALHAARRALEPDLPYRGVSSYLHFANDVLTLDANKVWIDVDHFQAAAQEAMSSGEVAVLEAALAAYAGELLPEDRYEDWATPHRDSLAALQVRLLLVLADAQERRGAYEAAIERLNQAVQEDPVLEEAHRRLMRLYAAGGSRQQAVRQYDLCLGILRKELDTEPDAETEALRQDILAGRVQPRSTTSRLAVNPSPTSLPPALQRAPSTPLFGRERVLQLLLEQLTQTESGSGGMGLLSGEAGVGKTRVVAEIARAAAARGTLVLWGTNYEQEPLGSYGPFVEALEGYLATLPVSQCQVLATQYPELVRLLPSLSCGTDVLTLALSVEIEHRHVLAAIVRFLSDLAAKLPVLLVVDDLHAAHQGSVQLLHHLAHLATQRCWLIMGTYREEDVVPGSELQRMIASTARSGLTNHINLRRLARQDCDRLVEALLPEGTPVPAVLEQVYALSLGNPLFIQELIGAMRGRGVLILVDGLWRISSAETVSVPRQVQRLVSVRVDGMQEDVQRVLTLVAAAGTEVSFPELCVAVEAAFDSPLSEEELLDTLDQALQAGVLEEGRNGYGFRHPLFQATLYDHLSRPRRVRLHAVLAQVFEQSRPEQGELLAYHRGQSRRQDSAALPLARAGNSAQTSRFDQPTKDHVWQLLNQLEQQTG